MQTVQAPNGDHKKKKKKKDKQKGDLDKEQSHQVEVEVPRYETRTATKQLKKKKKKNGTKTSKKEKKHKKEKAKVKKAKEKETEKQKGKGRTSSPNGGKGAAAQETVEGSASRSSSSSSSSSISTRKRAAPQSGDRKASRRSTSNTRTASPRRAAESNSDDEDSEASDPASARTNSTSTSVSNSPPGSPAQHKQSSRQRRGGPSSGSGSAVPTKLLVHSTSLPYWSQSLYSSSPAVITMNLMRMPAGLAGGAHLAPSSIRNVASEEALSAGGLASGPSAAYSPYFGSRLSSSLRLSEEAAGDVKRPLQFIRVKYPRFLHVGGADAEEVVAYISKKKGMKAFDNLEILCELWTPGAELTQQQGTIAKIEGDKRDYVVVTTHFNIRSLLLSSIRRYPSQRGENIIRGIRFLLILGDELLDEWPRGKMAPLGAYKSDADLALCEAHLIWYIQNGPLPQITWGGLRAAFGGYFEKEIGEPLPEQSLLFLGRKMALNDTQLVDLSTVIPFTTFIKSRVSQWLVLAVKTIKECKPLWDNYTLKIFLEQADAVNLLQDLEAEPGDFLLRLPSQLARESDTKFLAQREGASLVITLVALGNDRKLRYLKADVSTEEREASGFIHSKADLRRVLCTRDGQPAKLDKSTCCFNRLQVENAQRRAA